MMARTEEHDPNWGGKRKGAGRPKRNAARVELGLTAEEVAIVDAYQARHDLPNRSEAFRRAIREHMGRSSPS